MKNIQTLLLVFVLTGVLALGCSQKKRIEGTEVPTLPQSNETAAPPAPPAEMAAPAAPEAAPPPVAAETPVATPETKYMVVTGDTLWGIAGMDIAYKDNFQWPLIFKANRDQIKITDLIYPKQEFLLKKDFSQADIDKARKDASDTPKYVPHTEPRETLPVDYF